MRHPRPRSGQRPRRLAFGGLRRWEAALVAAVVAVIVLGTSISSQFTSSYSLFTPPPISGGLAIMALPMTLIITTGEIDLSAASTRALSAELTGELWLHHWAMPVIIVCLAMGTAAGAVNGFLVTRLGLPSWR